jgi:1,2-phenylacetyl-CoA epoxidase catalytic subunit
LYAEGWLETLAKNPGTRAELETSMRRIYPETLAWFDWAGPEGMKVAVREKIIAAPSDEMRRTFVEKVQRSLREAGGIELRAS